MFVSELTFGLFMVPVISFAAALIVMSVVLPKLEDARRKDA